MRMKTVLRPNATPDPMTGQYRMRDYIAVPAITTFGTFKMLDIVAIEQLAALARWANEYETRRTRGMRVVGSVMGKTSKVVPVTMPEGFKWTATKIRK